MKSTGARLRRALGVLVLLCVAAPSLAGDRVKYWRGAGRVTASPAAASYKAGADAPGIVRVQLPALNVPVLTASFYFVPPVVIVPAGSTVTWSVPAAPTELCHTVTTSGSIQASLGGQYNGASALNPCSGGASGPDVFDTVCQNVLLCPGDSFSHTFNTSGTFNYFCRFHFNFGMIGLVIVQ